MVFDGRPRTVHLHAGRLVERVQAGAARRCLVAACVRGGLDARDAVKHHAVLLWEDQLLSVSGDARRLAGAPAHCHTALSNGGSCGLSCEPTLADAQVALKPPWQQREH